jgi:c-di-GMP-binding flagellar brake protein YcgR
MEASRTDRRRYVRHPIRVPVDVRPRGDTPDFVSRVADLSEGGLAFVSPQAMATDAVLDISLPVGDQRFTVAATVVRCLTAEGEDSYRIGVAFLHPAMAFRMKIAEQILRIHELQRSLCVELGREVSIEEAATQWVENYAKEFAELYS